MLKIVNTKGKVVKPQRRGKSGRAINIDWFAVREDYIAENLILGKRYTLSELAKRWSLTYATVKNKASKEGWSDLLAEAKREKAKGALDRLKADATIVESDIRVRQAAYAQVASEKAIQALRRIDIDQLKIRDIIDLLKLGLVEERRALGFADAYQFINTSSESGDQYQTPEEHEQAQSRLKDLSDRLLAMSNGNG